MSKYVKELLQRDYENRLEKEEIEEFIIISTKSIAGNDNNEMRGELQQKGIHLMVVKNSMFKKALARRQMEDACELFDGPCTVAYGGDSIVDIARNLVEWSKKLEPMELKGAYLEGSSMGQEGVMELSKMPNRRQLQSRIVGAAQSPGGNLVSAINGPANTISACIKTIIDNAQDAEKEAA